MTISMRAIKTTRSSTVAVGAAAVFVAAAAVLGLLGDDRPDLGAGWHLRGGFTPDAPAAGVALPARMKPV